MQSATETPRLGIEFALSFFAFVTIVAALHIRTVQTHLLRLSFISLVTNCASFGCRSIRFVSIPSLLTSLPTNFVTRFSFAFRRLLFAFSCRSSFTVRHLHLVSPESLFFRPADLLLLRHRSTAPVSAIRSIWPLTLATHVHNNNLVRIRHTLHFPYPLLFPAVRRRFASGADLHIRSLLVFHLPGQLHPCLVVHSSHRFRLACVCP